jgi:hypothetical protein
MLRPAKITESRRPAVGGVTLDLGRKKRLGDFLEIDSAAKATPFASGNGAQ